MQSHSSSNNSLNMVGVSGKQKFAKRGVYKNAVVAVKEFKVRKFYLSRSTLKQMQEVGLFCND